MTVAVAAPVESSPPSTAQLVAEIAADISAMASPTMDNVVMAVGARLGIVPSVVGARTRNLACWCKPGFSCHANVLLGVANAPEDRR